MTRSLYSLCIFVVATLALITPFSGAAYDSQNLKKRMCNDLEIIKNTFEVGYAPTVWKKSYAQWDLNEAISKAQITVLAKDPLYIKDYQKIVKKFFQSARDHHVGVLFCKTSAAFLPFRIGSAEGRYFITWVDPQEVPEDFKVGDEVLKINDIPINTYVQDFKAQEFGETSIKTDQSLAEMYLTMRIGAKGQNIPNSSIKIDRKSQTLNTEIQDSFEWVILPEEVSDGPYQMAKQAFTAPAWTKSNSDFFSKEMTAEFYFPIHEAHKNYLAKTKKADQEFALDGKYSNLPPLGEILWENDSNSFFDTCIYKTPSFFEAYIFKTPNDHKVGFIRIGSYMSIMAQEKEFSDLINKFQKECSGLVIDQQNNSGGLILYMYALGSMLSDKPLKLPMHRMTITQTDAFYALNSLQQLTNQPENNSEEKSEDESEEKMPEFFLFGYPIDAYFNSCLINHYQFIIQEWNAGRHFTNPNYLYGIDELRPHPWGTFNKPILFLVNQLDFSCADFLPALLQDNKRATIFGTTTAGAGGYVISHSFPNRFGILRYSYTGSIIERFDKTVIENLGITPDVICDLTAKDLTDNYSDYKSKLLTVLDGMLPETEKSRKEKAERERRNGNVVS